MLIVFMIKHHGYRVPVYFEIFLKPSLLTSYRSLLTAHMIAIPPPPTHTHTHTLKRLNKIVIKD